MTVVATSAPPPHDVAMHGTAGLAADATTLVQARHHGLLQQEEIYIFGFGSLVHHPGFDHVEEERVVGFIRGYRRVFWQGSTDHRGVPGAPGRVVTLEPCADGVVWGVAYRLAGDRAQQLRTLQYLEWREKQYDVWAQVEVFTADSPDAPVAAAIAFIASSDRKRNPNYLGPAPLDDIAQQIATAHGPSGPNWQYVYKLAAAQFRGACKPGGSTRGPG